MSTALPTLIKMQKTRVEDQQQILAKLQDHLERVERSIEDHLQEMKDEKEAAHLHPDMNMTYADYVVRAMARTKELKENRQVASQAVDLARDQLAQLFEEQKRYEIAKANFEAKEELKDRKIETKEMDEIGGIAHERRRKGDVH